MGYAISAAPSGTKLMVMGDSITAGSPHRLEGSYRPWLYRAIYETTPFQFVGQRSYVDGPSIWYDREEGVPGDTIADIVGRYSAAIDTYTPEVVVLCAGVNDLAAGTAYGTVLADLAALVDLIAVKPSVAQILVTDVTILGGAYAAYASACASYNTGIAAAVAGCPKAVYAGSVFAPVTTADGVHPNRSGYRDAAAALVTPVTAALTLAAKSYYESFIVGRGLDGDCVQFLAMDEATGNLADSSGNGNDATIPGSITYQQPPLAPLNDYSVIGSGASNSYVSAGAILGATEWTIQLVINGSAASADAFIAVGAGGGDYCAVANFSGNLFYRADPLTGTFVSNSVTTAVPSGRWGLGLRKSAAGLSVALNGEIIETLDITSKVWSTPTLIAYGDAFGWGGFNEAGVGLQHRGTFDVALSDVDFADGSNLLVLA